MLFQQINGKKVYVVLADTKLSQQQAVSKGNLHFKTSPKNLKVERGYVAGQYLWIGSVSEKDIKAAGVDVKALPVWVVTRR